MTSTPLDIATTDPWADYIDRSAQRVRTADPAEIAWRVSVRAPTQYTGGRVPTRPQQAFLCNHANHGFLEAGFGGAAGGGKSDALLLGALQYVDQPGYAALLLRRTFKDLMQPDALIPRSFEYLAATDARWNGNTYTWHFPSGATLSFGYLANDNDVYQYQGAAFAYVGFDELTQFTEWQYRYLFSRVRRRRGMEHLPLRVRIATNPGGIGHAWVKRRFLDERDVPDEANKDSRAQGRLMVPAKVSDNPHLDADAYAGSLGMLDAVTRRQLLDGDWEARVTGSMFSAAYFGEPVEVHAVPPRATLRLARFWDLAGTEQVGSNDPDWTAGALIGLHVESGTWYILDIRRFRESPGETMRIVREVALADGADVDVYVEQEPGQSGKAQIAAYQVHIPERAVYGHRVSGEGDKVTRAKPISARASNGMVRLVRGPWIGAFLDEAEQFPHPKVHDDQVDAVSGGYAVLSRRPPVRQSSRMPKHTEPEVRMGDLVLRGREYVDVDTQPHVRRRGARRSR